MYDVTIIGAGIVGCAVARELAKYDLRICLLDKNEDVATETTKANSGIVHGGYAEKHGSVKAKFSVRGNALYQKLNDELHFGFTRVGSFVIGFDEQDAAKIKEIHENGKKNGAPNLQIVNGAFVHAKEPHLNKDIHVALYCPSAGITSPYEFAIALAENAIANGVELKLNAEVTNIVKQANDFLLTLNNQEKIISKLVINAAGLYADDVAKMANSKSEFTITPRQGQYLLLDKDQGYLANSVIFQTPTAVSKGILVTKTQHGNLLLGPDAEPAPAKDSLDTASKNVEYIIKTARKSLPDFDLRKVITSFAGNRAAPSTGDFIIGESEQKGFINLAGIESPGLTAAPAIAEYTAEIVAAAGMKLTLKTNFNPIRNGYKTVANMEEAELNELILAEPEYGRIVCRCETISEGEIRDALRRAIPINSIDAIKRRTRVGMGRCQGGFCTPKIMEIICDELNIEMQNITKKGNKSSLVIGRTKRSLITTDFKF
jgi:glycerol-3-phosphate dehydrogenase